MGAAAVFSLGSSSLSRHVQLFLLILQFESLAISARGLIIYDVINFCSSAYVYETIKNVWSSEGLLWFYYAILLWRAEADKNSSFSEDFRVLLPSALFSMLKLSLFSSSFFAGDDSISLLFFWGLLSGTAANAYL